VYNSLKAFNRIDNEEAGYKAKAFKEKGLVCGLQTEKTAND
jgi:hypothetical protein